MKKHLSLVLRLLVAAAGLAYIAYSITWTDQGSPADPQTFKPGILTMLRNADVALLLLGLLVTGLIFPILTLRWWRLMHSRQLDVPLGMTFRLTMVGIFFNYCMPGTTGGDLVKAFYAAQRKDRRADAIISVFIDRAVGMVGLVLLAGVAGLFMLEHPMARRLTVYVWSAAALLSLGAAVYFTPAVRRLLGINWLLARLPAGKLLATVDQAAVAYGRHRLAVAQAIGLSMLIHLCLATATTLAGYALGMEKPFGLMLTVVPLLFMAAAIPISYQGLGIMEGLAMPLLLDPPHATANHLVGMLVLIRLYQILYGLLGSLFLLSGRIHMHPQETLISSASAGPAADASACEG